MSDFKAGDYVWVVVKEYQPGCTVKLGWSVAQITEHIDSTTVRLAEVPRCGRTPRHGGICEHGLFEAAALPDVLAWRFGVCTRD